jgi:YHS domain-containing protein/thiol-disulfide isomerase/thioredoxin
MRFPHCRNAIVAPGAISTDTFWFRGEFDMRLWHALLSIALVAACVASQCPESRAQQPATTATAAAPAGIQWQTNLEEAKRLAAESNRLILVHFWSPSCVPCMQLEQNVFSQPYVQQTIQAKYVPLKLNADEVPSTTKQFGITRLPSDLIITPGTKIVGRMVSPPTPDAYLQQLAIASSGPSAAPASATAAATPAMPAASYPQRPTNQSPISPIAPANTTATNVVGAPQSSQPAKPVAPPIGAYSDSRYGEYFQRFGSAPVAIASNASPATQTVMPSSPVAATNPAMAAPAVATGYETIANPYAAGSRYAAAPTQTAATMAPPSQNPTPYFSAAGVPVAGSTQPAAPAINQGAPATSSAGEAPVGLEGYSPVVLAEQHRWQLGDRRWGVVHRGRTYLFSAPEEQQKFLANPDRYSPAFSGRDVVAALDYGQEVEGKRQFGVEFQGRVYLFSNIGSQRQFSENTTRYVTPIQQAEAPNKTIVR